MEAAVALVRKISYFALGIGKKSDEGLEPHSARATAARSSQALGADLVLQHFSVVFAFSRRVRRP